MNVHIVPKKIYFSVFAALLVLTFVTVRVALVDLGRFNTVIALTIAVSKALLVILYFMHVRYSSTRLIWVVIAAAFFWLGILIVLTLSDYLTRGWLSYPGY
ncbi:MAG: cytochrome C oxidase subunit IV family protein [Acidobacteriota bacterium]